MKKIIIILTLIVSTLIYLEIKNNEVVIPDSAIRLRVIPNSNTSVDQNIKNKVKKYLEENTYTLLEEVSDLKEARTLINANIENLDNDIGNIFKENNNVNNISKIKYATAIKLAQDAVADIKKAGYNVSLEEIDTTNDYQIIIKLQK